jgi:hypothetical protein
MNVSFAWQAACDPSSSSSQWFLFLAIKMCYYQSGGDDPQEEEDLAKFGLEAKYESNFFNLVTKVVMIFHRKQI